MPKVVILVAGTDYSRCHKKKGKRVADFAEVCKRRTKFLVRKFPDAKFVLLDVAAGEVRVNEAGKGQRKWNLVNKDGFTDLAHEVPQLLSWNKRKTCDRFFTEGSAFRRRQDNERDTKLAKNVMSAQTVYNHVMWYGKNEPGSIVELSFMSHGYYYGPILVNSFSTDPKDKDPRAKHFKHMPKKDREVFRAAFDQEEGSIRVWGCNFIKIYMIVFLQMVASRKLGLSYGNLTGDDQKFTFKLTQQEAKWGRRVDTLFFPAEDENGKYPGQFDAALSAVKRLFWRSLDDSFSKEIAKVTGLDVYGGLPGTWASLGRDGLLEVPRTFQPKPGVTNNNQELLLRFYDRYLKIKEDPEKRGYGTYTP